MGTVALAVPKAIAQSIKVNAMLPLLAVALPAHPQPHLLPHLLPHAWMILHGWILWVIHVPTMPIILIGVLATPLQPLPKACW